MQLDIETVIEQSKDPDPKVRREAVQTLCPCELKFNYEPAWNRLLEMTSDPDLGVRRDVLHVLCDGSPREREADVVQAIEGMYSARIVGLGGVCASSWRAIGVQGRLTCFSMLLHVLGGIIAQLHSQLI